MSTRDLRRGIMSGTRESTVQAEGRRPLEPLPIFRGHPEPRYKSRYLYQNPENDNFIPLSI